jgi:hypothetical protein
MYVDEQLAGDFWTSVKKKWKFAQNKIKLDIDPRKLREKYAHDSAGLQKNIDAIVSPKAKQQAKKLMTLAQQTQTEKEAAHVEEVDLERARTAQVKASAMVIGGLGIGATALFFLLRRK